MRCSRGFSRWNKYVQANMRSVLFVLLSCCVGGMVYAQDAVLEISTVSQSSTSHNGVATRAIDGNTDGVWRNRSVTHTRTENQPWWSADLGVSADVRQIEIWNRTNNCCTFRLADFYVLVSESPFATDDLDSNLSDSSIWSHFHAGELDNAMVTVPVVARGRYVRIQLQGRNPLSLAEVIVFGTVAPPPPIAVDDAATVDSDSSVSISVLSNDSNVDESGGISVALTSPPGSGSAVALADGTILYTPSAGIVTQTIDSFTYSVEDIFGNSSEATVIVTIDPVIILEVLNPLSVTQSSTSHSGVASRAIDGNTDGVWRNRSVTHTRTEDQPWWSADLGVTADVGQIEIWNRTNNCCTFRLSDFYVLVSESPFATDDLDANLSDPSIWSHFHAGELDSAMVAVPVDARGRYVRIQLQGRNPLSLAEVIVSVLPGSAVANVAPIADAGVDITVQEGVDVTLDAGASTDVDGTIQSYRWTLDEVEVGTSVSQVLAGLATGVHVVNLEVTDNEGATDADFVLVTVNPPPNIPPIARDDSVDQSGNALAVLVGGSLTVDVLSNDSDQDGDVAALTVTATDGASGTTVVESDRSVTYSNNNGVAGNTDTFTYTITDAAGASDTATVTLTLIAPPNIAPVAMDDTAEVEEGRLVVIDVLANDSDADGSETIDTSTVTITQAPANGAALALDDGTVRYTPNADTTATEDTFSYSVADDQNAVSNIATVTVTITPVPNTAPVAVNDSTTVTAGQSVVIDVLTNDSDTDGSETIDASTVTITQAPANGAAVAQDDGTVRYTPNADTTATEDTFSYSCLLYTSPSPRDLSTSRMPSSA